MASFTPTNVPYTLVGREISIASSFVKQYYTLLNKAPHFIHNFYSQDSTFIHGTIEMANENHPGPIVGRERIRRKMKDLNLNDCRAKIKQIDCLETLAGGLVVQVIGELSNNRRPMRRFLQTFVLAPSPDEPRQDGDTNSRPNQANASGASRGGAGSVAGINANSNEASGNQRFFVMNSIFRYQDEGLEGEFGDDIATARVNPPADGPVQSGNDEVKVDMVSKPDQNVNQSLGVSNGQVAGSEHPQNNMKQRRQIENVNRNTDASLDKLANDLEDNVKLTKQQSTQESELKRDGVAGHKVVSNGTGAVDKKSETSEKLAENSKNTNANSQSVSASGTNVSTASQSTPVMRPQPSNEPKTWANMVRNYQPPATSAQINVNKPSAPQSQGEHQQQQHQNSNQPSAVQTHLQSPQSQQQQNLQNNNSNNNNNNNSNNSNNNSSNNNNNRRRHMMRKPSNKSTGRTIKSRPPRPPAAGKPAV